MTEENLKKGNKLASDIKGLQHKINDLKTMSSLTCFDNTGLSLEAFPYYKSSWSQEIMTYTKNAILQNLGDDLMKLKDEFKSLK